MSEKVERWDSGLDPIGLLDLVPFVGRSFVHQHIEYFKLYCDAILGNQVGVGQPYIWKVNSYTVE